MVGTEQIASKRYESSVTNRIEILYAIINVALNITELFTRSAERYTNDDVKILHCDVVDIEAVSDKVKSVTLCRVLA